MSRSHFLDRMHLCVGFDVEVDGDHALCKLLGLHLSEAGTRTAFPSDLGMTTNSLP